MRSAVAHAGKPWRENSWAPFLLNLGCPPPHPSHLKIKTRTTTPRRETHKTDRLCPSLLLSSAWAHTLSHTFTYTHTVLESLSAPCVWAYELFTWTSDGVTTLQKSSTHISRVLHIYTLHKFYPKHAIININFGLKATSHWLFFCTVFQINIYK